MDRNAEDWLDAGSLSRSLSARRAWIEIQKISKKVLTSTVALRKESVDRNALSLLIYHPKYGVALRKESVDRNSCWLLA